MIPIILLILLSAGLGEDVKPVSSDLQLIANDFRIVSRMLNAIYIHFGVTRNTFTQQEILLELTQVSDEVYKSIVNANITKLHKIMDIVEKEFSNAEANGVQSPDGFFLDLLEDLSVIMSNSSDFLEKAGTVRTGKMLVEKTNISVIFNNECLKLNTTNLNQFRKLVGKHNCWREFPENKYIKEVINNFNKQHTTLSNCIDNVNKLVESMKYGIIWDAINEFNQVEIVRFIAARLFQFKLDKTMFYEIEKNITDLWKSETEIMKSNPNIYSSSFIEAIQNLQKSVNTKLVINRNLPRHFTAGFRNVYDLPINSTDFENPWLNKYFGNDAHIHGLTESINSYINGSEKFVQVVKMWNDFAQNSHSLLDNGNVKRFAHHLDDYWNTSRRVADIYPYIQDIKSLAENCVQLNYGKEALQELVDYERQQYTPFVFIRRIGKLYKHVTKMDDYKVEGRRVLNTFNMLISFVSNIKSSGDVPLIDRYVLQDLLQDVRSNALIVVPLKMVTELAENLQKLKMESERLTENWSNTIKLNKILDKMNLKKFAECVRDKGRNVSKAFAWYQNHLLSKKHVHIEGINVTRKYIEGIANVQKYIDTFHKEVDNEMNQLKQKLPSATDTFHKFKEWTKGIGFATTILEDMEKVLRHENELRNITNLSHFGKSLLEEFDLNEWKDSTKRLETLMKDVEELNSVAGTLRNANILNKTAIFLKASTIQGIPGSVGNLQHFYEVLNRFSLPDAIKDAKKFKELADLNVNLDFARFEKNLKEAANLMKAAEDYLLSTFRSEEVQGNDDSVEPEPETSDTIGLCVGLICFLILLVLLVCGLTKNGRKRCQNWYLYYFVNWKVFEKRWRYSLFLDTIDMKNALLDAVRERNKANLLKALKGGAYINVYNKYGNTALHVATKTGLPEFVDILIKYGADRSLLNARNLTPEEMIPPNFNKTHSKDASKFEKIEAIYKKYQKKKFRIAVPQVFPVSSFHIWMDESTNDNLTNAFMEKFPHITSIEALHTTTHVIFPTDAAGVVQIDRLEQLTWIFHGAIIVKEQWMADCLKDPKLIEHDSKYLVEKVRFNGVVYDTVLQWTEAMAKSTMPYLCGAYVAVVMKECSYLSALNVIVTNQGGVMMPSFPVKDDFNIGSHPCLHANLGPLFLIYDGTFNLVQYKNDPDKMYTIFTKNEFIAFLLKRQINRDTRKNPPPVSKDEM